MRKHFGIILKASLFVAALWICVPVVAEEQIEPLLNRFDKHANAETANRFFGELLKEKFIDEKLTFEKSVSADSLQQQVWYWAAEWFYAVQKYDLAEQYAIKALPKYHPSNHERADCLNLLGCIYVRMGNIEQAALYAKQCVEMEMRGGDHDLISSSLNTLAGIYMAGYQAKEAEKYILQALEHANKVDNPGRKAIILGMASEIYHTLGDDAKALSYADEACEIENKLNRPDKKAIRLSQKGSALLGLHRYEEAEEIYRQIIPTFEDVGDYHSAAIAMNRLGMALLCQKREREAIPYYRKAATLFSKMGDLYNEIHSHRGLYESYWKINPDSAKIELDYFDLLKDSLYTHSTAEALSRYNAEFGNDSLRQENTLVRQAHRRTIVVSVIAVLLIALCAWIVICWIRRRQKLQMQELVREIENLKSSLTSPAKEIAQEPEDAVNEVETDEERRFLMRVIEVVNEAMSDGNVGVEHVAQELNMSVQTFRRRLLSAAGESPKSYIQAIQMGRAVNLLSQNPGMPVQEIANLCGFDEASSFTHAFKRIYGCSPSQYRDSK